jgi:hypothetical protein
LVAHLPLILVFAFFFLLTAETWEIAVETRDWEFCALVCGLFIVSFTVLAWDAVRSVRESSSFDEESLRSFLRDPEKTRLSSLPEEVSALLGQYDPRYADQGPVKHPWLRRLNALLVMATYQAIIVLPLTIVTAMAFWILAEASVPPEVAATWIMGDAAPGDPKAIDAITNVAWLDDPWLRVPLFLTSFAVLERVVRIVTEKDQRNLVLGPADHALKIRFSVAWLQDHVQRI